MFLLKLIGKIILIPIMLALTLIQWIGIFLNSISGVVLGILAFIFALTGIASLAFGLASGPEALKMIAAGFVIFMIPLIGDWVLDIIETTNIRICRFIKS
ncbi:MAG: hypothetical protein J5933_00710 [Clostridia bacterium]|nr:hypothetical protein [Clostridia bacterium]